MKKLLMSMRVTEAVNYHEERNSIAFEYIQFFEAMGFMIILIPNNTVNIDHYISDDIDLVVLSGGNNVNSKRYNSKDILDDVYEIRDQLEAKLTKRALEKSIPILGICRGFHFLNVYFGGSLFHRIEEHVNLKHELKSSLDLLDGKFVNSYHNQAIIEKNLSSDLDALGYVGEVVEVFLNREQRVLGIQWHPERQDEEIDRTLILKFLKGIL